MSHQATWKVAPLRTATQHSAEQPLWVRLGRFSMSAAAAAFVESSHCGPCHFGPFRLPGQLM
jgi:hypothetical protein